MQVLHILENIDDTYGGPAKSVPYLSAQLTSVGIDSQIRTTYHNIHEKNSIVEEHYLPVRRFRAWGPRQLRFSPGLWRGLFSYIRRAKDPIILHVHNLRNWPTFTAFLIQAFYSKKTKLIITPRGSLFPWSLSQKKYRKKLLRRLFQKRMLCRADRIHVTSEDEATVLRQRVGKDKITIIPNGIELDEFTQLPSNEESRSALGIPSDRKYLLFLSRIHAKKGFDYLAELFVQLATHSPDLDLLIAGPKEDMQLRNHTQNLFSTHGLLDRVHDLGTIQGKERIFAYRAADIFVLPSQTENFGIAIAEALASKIAVVVSDQTPWHELHALGGGYCVPREQMLACIEHILSFDPVTYQQMTNIGSTYVFDHYDWKKLQQLYVQMYRDLV